MHVLPFFRLLALLHMILQKMRLQSAQMALTLLFWLVANVIAQGNDPLLPCGDAFYHASEVSTFGKGKEK